MMLNKASLARKAQVPTHVVATSRDQPACCSADPDMKDVPSKQTQQSDSTDTV